MTTPCFNALFPSLPFPSLSPWTSLKNWLTGRFSTANVEMCVCSFPSLPRELIQFPPRASFELAVGSQDQQEVERGGGLI